MCLGLLTPGGVCVVWFLLLVKASVTMVPVGLKHVGALQRGHREVGERGWGGGWEGGGGV
jgi:hypothetical protein